MRFALTVQLTPARPAALLSGALLVAMLALGACSSAPPSRIEQINLDQPAALPTPPANGEAFPIQPPSVVRGAAIYEEKCVACHGLGGEGDGSRSQQIRAQGRVVANLTNPALLRAAKPYDWHVVITAGRIGNLMPGFSGSLNAQQRWDVQAYVWALGTKPDVLTNGRTAYAAQCASCHGASGEGGSGPGFQDGRWLAEASLLDMATRMARGDAHASIKLNDDARFALAQTLRAFAYEYAEPAGLLQARTTGAGTLEVRAVNLTAGGPQLGNIPIVLRALDQNGEVFSRTATLDSGGVAMVRDLPQRLDYFYQAEVDYGGGRFYAAPAQLFTTTQSVSAVLQIYETTTDARDVKLNNVLFAVRDVGEGEITVVEIYEFDNAGDRAFVGGADKRTLRVTVPKDAKNLRFDGLGFGRRFVQDGELIYDTEVTVPGAPAQRITMIYELPYRGETVIERKVFYPLSRWNVFLPDTQGLPGEPLRVDGPVQDRGVQEADGTRVRLYSGNGPFGDTVRFSIAGRPLAQPQPGEDQRSLAIALMALAVALAVCAYLAYRVRTIRMQFFTPERGKQTLLSQLAALDDAFAQGKVKPADYQRQRAQLKDELKGYW